MNHTNHSEYRRWRALSPLLLGIMGTVTLVTSWLTARMYAHPERSWLSDNSWLLVDAPTPLDYNLVFWIVAGLACFIWALISFRLRRSNSQIFSFAWAGGSVLVIAGTLLIFRLLLLVDSLNVTVNNLKYRLYKQDQIPVAAPVEKTKIISGVKVTVREERGSNQVAVFVGFPAGIAAEPDTSPGVGIFTAHVYRRAYTATHTRENMRRYFGDDGTRRIMSVNYDNALFGSLAPAAEWKNLLTYELDAAANFHPTEADIVLAREQLSVYQYTTKLQINDKIRKFRLGNHPCGRPAFITPESMRDITLAKVEEYLANNYRPAPIAIVAVGDISAEDFFQEISWKMPERKEPIFPPAELPATNPAPLLLAYPDATGDLTSAAFVLPPDLSPDALPARLAAIILKNRLHHQLPDKTGFTFTLEPLTRFPNLCVFQIPNTTVSGIPPVDTLTKEFANFSKSILPEELKTARQELKNFLDAPSARHYRHLNSQADSAQILRSEALALARRESGFTGLFSDFWKNEKSISEKDVLAAGKYFARENVSIVNVKKQKD